MPVQFGTPHIYSMLVGDRAVRVVVAIAALAVIYLRMPTIFTNPQFWGEDGGIFFVAARVDGWHSLLSPVPGIGYFTSLQRFIAVFGSYLPTLYVPAFYNAAAVAFTLLIVWLTTSPRFDMPMRPLLALAIVVVPTGYEVLGTMTNLQWVVPIGAFALLFTRPGNFATLAGEAVLVAFVAFTGPFSLFLTPIFAWRWFVIPGEPAAGHRMLLFTVIMAMGALTQVGSLYLNRDVAFLPGDLPTTPYVWTQWFNIPLSILLGKIGSGLFAGAGYRGPVVAAILLPLVAVFALQQPYRQQKIAMLLFGIAIMLSGMMKYRASLPLLYGSSRYFYVLGVFGLWFMCCLSMAPLWRYRWAALVAIVQAVCIAITFHTPRGYIDYEWPKWAAQIDEGKGVTFPVNPGWMIKINAPP
jgi:hypothetical protein